MPTTSEQDDFMPPGMRVSYTPTSLPEVANLSSVEHTDFVPTLEHRTTPGRNAVYAPTLLYAWEEIVQQLGGSVITTEENSASFLLLTISNSHTNALRKNEYSIEVSTKEGQIRAKAFFHKSLPFYPKLERIAKPLLFGQSHVAAFGMEKDADHLSHLVEIAYYENDQDFVLRLSPKDRNHEIILAKGISDATRLSDAVDAIYQRIEQGKEEMKHEDEAWKYKIDAQDSIIIPIIAFNLETNYTQIEGQRFFAQSIPWDIRVAYQRTAVVLDENGAVVESLAVFAVVGAAAPPPPKPTPKPKQLVFDQCFYLLFKRREQRNPYVVMKVENAELLTPALADESLPDGRETA